MQITSALSTRRRWMGSGLVALAALLALAMAVGTAAGASKRLVKIEETSQRGSVLANLNGRTLYSLSVEKRGRFICVGSCLSLWHPLVVKKGTKPTGPVALGTVKRPDGRVQVTFRGMPLYHFAQDAKAGETNGEGLKDVGTWHAAKPGKSATEPTQPQEPPPSSPPAESPPYGY
jgi:predicted lipoprotein with Yx(FWY)xxD motif